MEPGGAKEKNDRALNASCLEGLGGLGMLPTTSADTDNRLLQVVEGVGGKSDFAIAVFAVGRTIPGVSMVRLGIRLSTDVTLRPASITPDSSAGSGQYPAQVGSVGAFHSLSDWIVLL